ncbi:HET-domain-containing protein, partial [Acephala macrosclerotiorum]
INLAYSSGENIGIGPSFYGRIVNRPRTNMDLAKSWLEECVNLHGSLCENPGKSNDYERTAPQDLRVIDVQYMCLVMLPPGSRYIALSYCWGSSNQHFTTTKSRIAELEKRKSLERIFSSLSGTIQDAIHCVRELGERFLWVDALCIIQDNDQEKEAQILQMDRVYESSLITIISASPLPKFSFYMDMVERYSCRNMSNQGDALIALEGVLEVLRKTMQTHFIWGLPESLFDDALLWRQLGPHHRRDVISNGYHGRQFPTWSWVGWEDRSNYEAYFLPIYTRPEIDWFLITKDGMIAKLFRIERALSNNSFNAAKHQIVRPRGSPPTGFLKKLRSRNEINRRDFNSASIVCWTSIASFRFSGGIVDEGKEASNWPHHQIFIIYDSESRDIGAIRMERTWAARLEEEKRFQFMLLSRANTVENMTHLDEDTFPIHDWCFLNILFIQRTGESAQRLGIGWVHEKAWVNANPVPTLLRL